MFGSDGRIGLITPSSNIVIEREFATTLPPEIGSVTSRVRLSGPTEDDLRSMLDSVGRCTVEVDDARCDVIAFACTSGSFIGGLDGSAHIDALMKRHTSASVFTTSEAVAAALRALDCRAVAMATPYTDAINAVEIDFLRRSGFEVSHATGLGLTNGLEIGSLRPDQVLDLAASVDVSGADCLFLSCTNMATFDSIGLLEERLGIPVVSSNSATLWRSLTAMRLPAPSAVASWRLFTVG